MSISPLMPSTWPIIGDRVYRQSGDITETGLVIARIGTTWTDTRVFVDWDDAWRGEFAQGPSWSALCNIRTSRI